MTDVRRSEGSPRGPEIDVHVFRNDLACDCRQRDSTLRPAWSMKHGLTPRYNHHQHHHHDHHAHHHCIAFETRVRTCISCFWVAWEFIFKKFPGLISNCLQSNFFPRFQESILIRIVAFLNTIFHLFQLFIAGPHHEYFYPPSPLLHRNVSQ